MRIEEDVKLDFSDVLIRPKRSTLKSRQEVMLERPYRLRHTGREWSGVPIIAANMDTVGTFAMARALAGHGLATALHKHYSLDQLAGYYEGLSAQDHDHVFYTLGITEADREKWAALNARLAPEHRPVQVCIDVANGYTEQFADFVKRFRDDNPDSVIMAGNVVTGEMVEEHVLNGADIVKVGIGSGSVCTTRKLTGVGYPQLSAVIECADAAHGLKGLVCSDGGCTEPGDIVKAFAGGADFVMLGGMFAGHDQCEGEVAYPDLSDEQRRLVEQHGPGSDTAKAVISHTRKVMQFYGMSSDTAMHKHAGGVSRYRASEGKTVQVPYRGDAHDTVLEIMGGLRSACTYVGAVRLKELSKRATFLRVNQQRNLVFGPE